MKKTGIILVMTLAFIAMNAHLLAEDVLGCPKGIMKGTIWPRIDVSYVDATQKFDFSTCEMVDINKGTGLQKKTKTVMGFRLGYGLTTKMDIGILAKYSKVKVEKLKNSQVTKTDESVLTGLWLSAKYIFLDAAEMKPFSYMKLSAGAGYKIPLCKDDDLITKSVSNGAYELKAGFLTHGGIGPLDFAGHLLYWYRGQAKEVENTQGKPAYGKSGVELADRINYMLKLEYDIHPVIGLGIGGSGWTNLSKEKTWQNNVWYEENFYTHNVMLSLDIRPFGLDYEKRKLFCHVGIPYAVKNNTAPDYTLKTGLMYTFY